MASDVHRSKRVDNVGAGPRLAGHAPQGRPHSPAGKAAGAAEATTPPKKKVPAWLNSRSWSTTAASSTSPGGARPSSSPTSSSSSSTLKEKEDDIAKSRELPEGAAGEGVAGGPSRASAGLGPPQAERPARRTDSAVDEASRKGAASAAAAANGRRPASEGGMPVLTLDKQQQEQQHMSASALLATATAADRITAVPVPSPVPAAAAGSGGLPRVMPGILQGPFVVEPFTLATASAADHAYEKRVNRFYAEISRAKVNLPELRRLAVHGIPNEGSLRAITWKLLLGYLPVVRDEWETELAKKRAQYMQFTTELLLNPTDIERKKSREARMTQHRSTVARWDSVATESIWAGKELNPAATDEQAGQGEGEGEAGAAGVGQDPDGARCARAGEEEEEEMEVEEDGEIEVGQHSSSRSPAKSGEPEVLPWVRASGSSEPVEDHPLSSSPSSLWHQFFQDSEIAEQILRDIKRTHPEMPFFMQDDGDTFTPAQEAMRRLLMVFAKLNPGIRYVQGMNEVLAPIIYVFMNDPDADARANAEADAFFCFVEVLSDFRDFFCQQLDNSVVGIRSAIQQLSDLLKMHDEELWRNLMLICKLDPQYYAFRWITLLLTQEFGFPQILRIWDAILGSPDGPMAMLLRICCSMMMCIRDLLLAGDFTANLKLLQKYPPSNVERILQTAERLRGPGF